MLFPIETVTDQDLITTTTESVNENRRHIASMKANALMNQEQRKHRPDRIPDDVKSEVSEFFLSVEISRQVPDKKQVLQITDEKGEKVI